MKKYGVLEKDIFVLTPGVDTDFFTTDVNTTKLLDRYSLHESTVLLTVGRLDKRKGHDHVILSLPDVVEEYPNLIYLIVGDGEERTRLLDLAEKLNMTKHVIFTGPAYFEDLPSYYNLCDLFIMANREADGGDTEGFGMVFIEANACGKPVIAGSFGGAVEAVEEGVSGVFTDSCNPKAIAKSLIQLLKNDSARQDLGSGGRKRVIDNFTWKTKQQEFQKILITIGIKEE